MTTENFCPAVRGTLTGRTNVLYPARGKVPLVVAARVPLVGRAVTPV